METTKRKTGGIKKMNEKIKLAIAYAAAHGNTEDAKNNAANIYSSNYEEYMTIWTTINNM